MSKKPTLTIVDDTMNLDAELSGDFTVDEDTGEAFISFRKLSELLNVPRSTIKSRTTYCDTKQGISSDLMQEVGQYYAEKPSLRRLARNATNINKHLQSRPLAASNQQGVH